MACCGRPLNILKKPGNILTSCTYLFIDLGALLVPFIFSFHPALRFHRQWKFFFPANLLVSLVFIAWDMLFTQMGVWGFNSRYLCGISVCNLPLEEVLFFFCIPYASLFTYHCLKLFFKQAPIPARTVSAILIAGLLITCVAALPKLYTSVTCFSLALVLLYITFILKSHWLPHFYLCYLLILIPFFIVNGLLTGSWTDEPVVWYNDRENLGIRLLTIPVEDVFYGMLLLILNTCLYERFGKAQRS